MKIELSQTAVRGEEWEFKNRRSHVYPPPNDGREWILADDAAALFDISLPSMRVKMRRIGFTRTCRRGVKTWLLKKEVMDYLAFTKDRTRWYKRRKGKDWEPMIDRNPPEEEDCFKRVFWTTAQAAEFMGVSKQTITRWGRKGIIPIFVTRKQGKGGRNYYSPTSLRNLKEDEEFLKKRAIYEKGKATMQQGIIEREVYRTQHTPRTYPSVPKQWLTMREVAERLGISISAVSRLRKMERFNAEQLVGKWDQKQRPWFIHEDSVKELENDEYYQKTRRHGRNAVNAMIGKQIFTDPDDSALPQCLTTESSDLSFGYTREERRIIKADEMW